MLLKFWPPKGRKLTGLTLLELVISISLFAVLTLVATRAYTKITEIQDRTKDLQNMEGDLRYAMNVLADEAKNATPHTAGGDPACGGAGCNNVYFCTSLGQLYLRDKNGVCVTYSLSGSNIVINRNGTNYTITSNDVTVSTLTFATSTAGDRVLLKLRASGSTDYNKTINYQTAVTNTKRRGL